MADNFTNHCLYTGNISSAKGGVHAICWRVVIADSVVYSGNYSSVDWYIQWYATGSTAQTHNYQNQFSLILDGETIYDRASIGWATGSVGAGTVGTIASGSRTYYHNDDGSRSIQVTFRYYNPEYTSGNPVTSICNGNGLANYDSASDSFTVTKSISLLTVPRYYIDLNAYLDSSSSGSLGSFGYANVYINGSCVSSGCTDFYSRYSYGTTYQINVWPSSGHSWSNGGTETRNVGSGTLTSAVNLYPYLYTLHTISYDANGGSGAPSSHYIVYNCGSTLSSTRPTRAGYTFLGWKYDGSSTIFQPGATWPNGWGGCTLRAQWQASAGVYVYDGSSWRFAIPYVWDGSQWRQCLPYTYDGSSWRLMGK